MLSVDDLPERPEWLPESCYAELSTDTDDPEVVREMARQLCFAPVMEKYWRSDIGAALSDDPRGLWDLATCAVSARDVENPEGGRGGIGSDPDWLLKPKSERKKLCKEIERRSRELRELVAGSQFDQPAGMMTILGKVGNPKANNRADGPPVSLVLEALGAYARSAADKVQDEPVFNATQSQRVNFTLSALYRFHKGRFDTSEKAAHKRSGEVAAAIWGHAEPLDEGSVLNATRGRRLTD